MEDLGIVRIREVGRNTLGREVLLGGSGIWVTAGGGR
jgi:hypothetical protein